MSLVPLGYWWWPLFPYWTPNRTIRSNVLLGVGGWPGEERDIRGQWGDREWVTYVFPPLSAIRAAEQLFPQRGVCPPWAEIANELYAVMPWSKIESLTYWEALEALTRYRMSKAQQRQEVVDTFITILKNLQNIPVSHAVSLPPIQPQSLALHDAKPERAPETKKDLDDQSNNLEKVKGILQQLFLELAPYVERISRLADEIDRNYKGWLARDALRVVNPLKTELEKVRWNLCAWYVDDPAIKEFPKKTCADVALRSLFVKLDYAWQFLLGAIDKIDRCISGNWNLGEINFAAEVAQPLQELMAAGRRYGFLPPDQAPEFPAFRQDDDIGQKQEQPETVLSVDPVAEQPDQPALRIPETMPKWVTSSDIAEAIGLESFYAHDPEELKRAQSRLRKRLDRWRPTHDKDFREIPNAPGGTEQYQYSWRAIKGEIEKFVLAEQKRKQSSKPQGRQKMSADVLSTSAARPQVGGNEDVTIEII